MKKISEALDQYTGICKEAIVDSATKLSKSFEKIIIEILLLYMVVPGKINFIQLSRSAASVTMPTYATPTRERGRANRAGQRLYFMSNLKLLMANTFLTKRIFDGLLMKNYRCLLYFSLNQTISSLPSSRIR